MRECAGRVSPDTTSPVSRLSVMVAGVPMRGDTDRKNVNGQRRRPIPPEDEAQHEVNDDKEEAQVHGHPDELNLAADQERPSARTMTTGDATAARTDSVPV